MNTKPSKKNQSVENREVHRLLTRLTMLLAPDDGKPPLFDVAIDAIRDCQNSTGARENSRLLTDILPERISNQIARDLQVVTIDELEKVRLDRLFRMKGFGRKILMVIAAELRKKFPKHDDVSQWYWISAFVDGDG